MTSEKQQKPAVCYVSSKVLIFRDNGEWQCGWGERELLLLKYRGEDWYWDIPGGRMNVGENGLDEALRREVREEMGWNEGILDKMEVTKCWGMQSLSNFGIARIDGLVVGYYEVKFTGVEVDELMKEVKLNEEHQAWEWCKMKDLTKRRNWDGRKLDWWRGAEKLAREEVII